jgi:hypothetical protein
MQYFERVQECQNLKKSLEAALNYFPNEIDKKACLVTHKRLKIQDQSIIKSLASPHLWYWPPSRAFFYHRSDTLVTYTMSRTLKSSALVTILSVYKIPFSFINSWCSREDAYKLIPQSAMHNATFLQYMRRRCPQRPPRQQSQLPHVHHITRVNKVYVHGASCKVYIM